MGKIKFEQILKDSGFSESAIDEVKAGMSVACGLRRGQPRYSTNLQYLHQENFTMEETWTHQ